MRKVSRRPQWSITPEWNIGSGSSAVGVLFRFFTLFLPRQRLRHLELSSVESVREQLASSTNVALRWLAYSQGPISPTSGDDKPFRCCVTHIAAVGTQGTSSGTALEPFVIKLQVRVSSHSPGSVTGWTCTGQNYSLEIGENRVWGRIRREAWKLAPGDSWLRLSSPQLRIHVLRRLYETFDVDVARNLYHVAKIASAVSSGSGGQG